jgi:hypothetical protein
MPGDSTYDLLDWHDSLLDAGVVAVTPYNPRNTDEPLGIEYRVQDLIKQHSEDVQLKQSLLDETYNHRTGVERTTHYAHAGGYRRSREHRRRGCY